MAVDDSWMVIGEVAAPFGVRGEMKVQPLTDHPDRFSRLRRVYLGNEHRPYDVGRARLHKRQVVLTLSGITTPEDVDKLRGLDVSIPRSEAVPLEEGEYYLEDLIGMTVQTTEGAEVGRITDVLRTGSNDVYVVRGGRAEVLVPAIKDAVIEIDAAARRVVIEPWILLSESTGGET